MIFVIKLLCVLLSIMDALIGPFFALIFSFFAVLSTFCTSVIACDINVDSISVFKVGDYRFEKSTLEWFSVCNLQFYL